MIFQILIVVYTFLCLLAAALMGFIGVIAYEGGYKFTSYFMWFCSFSASVLVLFMAKAII